MAEDLAKLERVAAIIAKADGFVPGDGHGEGEFPIVNMSQTVERNGHAVPASPRAMAYVKTAREVIAALGKRTSGPASREKS